MRDAGAEGMNAKPTSSLTAEDRQEIFAAAHRWVKALVGVLAHKIVPILPSSVSSMEDRTVAALFSRAGAWGVSLLRLKGPSDWQAHSAGCRSLLEIAVDIALLAGGVEPVEKLIAWEEVRWAREMQSAPFAGFDDAQRAAMRKFLDDTKASEPTLIARFWPKGLPMRWTGAKSLRKDAGRADRLLGLKPPGLQDYERDNGARLNWATHGSGVRLALLVPTIETDLAVFALRESAWLLGLVVRITLAYHGLFSIEHEQSIQLCNPSPEMVALLEKVSARTAERAHHEH